MASCPGLGSQFDDGVCRVEPVEQGLRVDRVLVRREGVFFDDDLVARFRRAVKTDHHQVQVHGEGVHRHHLGRPGAGYARQAVGDVGMAAHPGEPGFEVAFDGIFSPGVALLQVAPPGRDWA